MSTRLKQMMASTAVSLSLISSLVLFLPFTLFAGNSTELNVSFSDIFTAYLPPTIIVLGLLVLIAMFLTRTLYLIFISLIATLSLLVWLQGNILVWDYGLLDGQMIVWSKNDIKGWFEFLVWSSALVFAIAGFRKFHQHFVVISVFLFFLQMMLLSFNFFTHTAKPAGETSKSSIPDSDFHDLYRFSSQDNIVHIIADGFQSDIFEEILTRGELGPLLSEALTGFTFYRNNLGVFPYTHMSVPAILTGEIYRNHIPLQKHLNSTLGGKSILSVANDAGYAVDMAISGGVLANELYAKVPQANLHQVGVNLHVDDTQRILNDASKIFDLSLFRVSPHFLKKYVYNNQLWLTQKLLVDHEFQQFEYFSHMEFLKGFSSMMTADRAKPAYKYFHLMLSHKPMVANGSCSYAGNVLEMNRENVIIQSTCSLVAIVNLFEKMKKLGIYNDATIILMGDHGAWVTPKNIKYALNTDDNMEYLLSPQLLALATPLLAIKPAGNINTLQISDAPSWIVDTAATITKLKNMNADFPGRSVFDLIPNETRERRFHYYKYDKSEWASNYLEPIEEFNVSGVPANSGSWQHVKTHLPKGESQIPLEMSKLWYSRPAK